MGDPIYHHQQFTRDIQQQQQVQQGMSSGLARYQSAPSSYFASLLNSNVSDVIENCEEFLTPLPSTPQTDQVSARFLPVGILEASSSHGLHGIQKNSSVNESPQTQFMTTPMKSENEYLNDQQQLQQEGSGYSSASLMIHQNQSQPTMSNRSPLLKPPIDSSYLPQMNISGGRNTNLLRQSSSPANFFSNFDIQGYDLSKSIGKFEHYNTTNLEASVPSPNRLKGQLDFSSGLPSSSGVMIPISEIENKNTEMTGTGFPFSSWDDSDILSDDFLKGLEDDERKTFSGMNASETQNNDVGNHRPPTMLSRHLSLPETSAMEKLLQDSVPCKIRAKRGCATHPRSIAERVRRTRISERMRKLQELVPNMDKQTNTSDMLDLAVDYIKDLRNQLQTLSDNRANCSCSNQQKQ